MPLDDLLNYALRITPGLVLVGMTFALTPRTAPLARILLLILGFVLIRDVMTPLGFWSFGRLGPAIWVRFRADALLLGSLAIASLGTVGCILWAVGELRGRVRWGDLRRVQAWGWGIGGAALILVPLAALASGVPLEARGGAMPAGVLPALLALTLAGNLLEEVLFRGLLQGEWVQRVTPGRAVLLSGLTFATGHIFLASTVTSVGAPLLVFTLVEGLVCAEVYRREGVLASTLTHGLTIFGLSAGLF